MAQVTIDMEAFSFEVPDENTLIINLDGGGCIRISVESLATLSMVINEVLTAPNQGSSTNCAVPLPTADCLSELAFAPGTGTQS